MESFFYSLQAKFPLLFRDPKEGLLEPIQIFGIECWPGWYNIIDQTLTELNAHILSLPKEEQSNYYIVQIKSKWAALEIYLSGYTHKSIEILNSARQRSKEICEKCGETGRLCGKSWLFTLCEKCEKERIKERGGVSL